MLSESLEAVIAQKLLKTKDGKGRTPARSDDSEYSYQEPHS